MRDAERRPFKINLSGKLTETFIVPSDAGIVSENRELMKKLFADLQQQYPGQRKPAGKSYFWAEVDWELAERFFMEFKFHRQIQDKKTTALDYLRKVSNKYPKVDIAFISLEKPKPGTTPFKISGLDIIYCQERAVGVSAKGDIRETLEEKGYYISNKQRVASREAEFIGLDSAMREQAASADEYYRLMPRPLLMLHALKLVHKKKEEDNVELLLDQVPAIGIGFPGGDYSITVDYVVNKVWVKQLQEESFDSPDEEEDYDN